LAAIGYAGAGRRDAAAFWAQGLAGARRRCQPRPVWSAPPTRAGGSRVCSCLRPGMSLGARN